MGIFISRDGQQFGPYPVEQVRELLNQGILQANDLAWHEGLEGWISLGELKASEPGDPPPPIPAQPEPAMAAPPAKAGGNIKLFIGLGATLAVLAIAAGAWLLLAPKKEQLAGSDPKPNAPGSQNPKTKAPTAKLTPEEAAEVMAWEIGTWESQGEGQPAGGQPNPIMMTKEVRWKEEGKSLEYQFSLIENGKPVTYFGHQEYDAAMGVFVYRSKWGNNPETTSHEVHDITTGISRGISVPTPANGEPSTTVLNKRVGDDQSEQTLKTSQNGQVIYSHQITSTRINTAPTEPTVANPEPKDPNLDQIESPEALAKRTLDALSKNDFSALSKLGAESLPKEVLINTWANLRYAATEENIQLTAQRRNITEEEAKEYLKEKIRKEKARMEEMYEKGIKEETADRRQSFDRVIAEGKKQANIDWGKVSFVRLEGEPFEKNGIKGGDFFIVLAYQGNNFKIKLDDCMHYPKHGWFLTHGPDWGDGTDEDDAGASDETSEGESSHEEPAPPEPAPNAPAKGLVAYYPFNGNARNEAGNNHHGQVFGAKLTADRHGKVNSAYQFKPGDHIKIDGLMGKPKNLTLSAWVKLDGQQGRLGSEIISLGDIAVLRADNKSPYSQKTGTGGIFFGGEKFWIHTMAKANYTGTGWHQIVFTFDDGANAQVTYVDGKQMASKENPKSIVYEGGGTDTFIGVHGKTAKQNWRSQGIIDDLRVYDRALTSAEVEKLFRSEKPAFPLQAGNPIKITTITELRAEAQGGNPQAQFSMGLKFINGSDGLKKNPQVTEKLWLRASKQGHLIAQMNLGLLYSRGALGEKDSLKGYQWAKLSVQGGHQRAKQLVETLEKELTPEQITEADKFVKNFIPVSENSIVEEPTNPEPNTQPVQYTILGTLTDQFDLTKAKTNVEDTLEAHPGVDLMVGLFEYNPPAILKSLKTANQLGKVKVVGFDENDATLQAIKDGTMHGTVVHNPYQIGYKSIEVLHALKQGKDHIIPKDGFIKIPARAIRRDNVEQFQATLKKHLKGPDPMAVSDDWPRFSIVTTGHAGFWTIASTGISEAGYDLRVQTEIHKPTQGVRDQNRILQELVAEGVDGIAISPLDPANQKAFLQDIAKKTILITNDLDVPESNRRAHISLNNYEAGRLCGKLVKEALPQGGEVMIFVGLLNSETAKLRRQGLVDELNNVEAPTKPEPKAEAKQLTPEEISEALSLRVGTFKVTEKASGKVLETFTGTWVKKGLSTEFRNTGENKAGAIVTYDPVQNLFIENFENGASIHHSTWNPLTKTLVRRLITPKPPAGESVTMFLRKIGPNQNDIRIEFRRNGELVRKIEAIGTRIEKPAELAPSTKPESSDDDKKPGTVLWEFETGDGVGSSPAIGPDGTVYVGSWDKKLYALSGKTGDKLWEFKTGDGVECSPAIGPDGTVYVGSDDGKLYALSGKTGDKLWEFQTGGVVVRSSPAIGTDGTLYVGSGDHNLYAKLYALSGKTGIKLWEFKTGRTVYSSPAIGTDGTVYVGSGDRKLYALSGKTGVKLWEFKTGREVHSSPAIGTDGTVYVGSDDYKLYALSGKTGDKLWEFKTGFMVSSSPAIGTDGTLYVGSSDKKLYAINGKTGVKLWEFKTGGTVSSSPTIGTGGTLYVGSYDKKLYAIKTNSKGLAKSPWPMRGQNPQHTGRAPKQ